MRCSKHVNAFAGQKLNPLDPVGLAIGTRIATSKKAKRELEDESYHRYEIRISNNVI